MKHVILIALVALCSVSLIAQAESLANSSYPINRANIQRNNHINRPILCSAVSNGRTTVLNREYALGGEYPSFLYLIPPVLDDQNNIYASTDGTNILKIDALMLNITQSANINYDAQITVGTNKLFVSSPVISAIYRTSDLVQDGATSNTGGDGPSSLAPYLSGLMIRALINEPYTSTIASYAFLNTSTTVFESTPQAPSVGSPSDAIVYKTDSMEFPIFVGQFNDNNNIPHVIISALGRYTVNITNTELLLQNNPFVVGNKLIVFTSTRDIYHYNAETGALLQKTSWNLFGSTNLVKNAMIKDSKALASLETENEDLVIVELYNNVTVMSGVQFAGHPVFSLVDNVVLTSVVDAAGYIRLLGLDWNDWSVKVVGEVGIPGNPVTSEPVIGEDCSVYMIVDGALHTYRPLPLQQVVPVIECIESDNTAYFSYQYLGSRSFNIPFVSDRNNLYPMALAPVTSFKSGSVDHYPFAPSIVLTTNPSGSYKWMLEDYTLEFANIASLRCPTTISLVLKFTASSSFDVPSFTTIVNNAFLNVTGISETRLVIGNITSDSKATRSVRQNGDSSLEVELQVGPGNPGDPSPSTVVTNFVTNQQTEFNNQVSNDPNAPSNVALASVTTKQPETAQSGVLNPSPPISEPVTSVPQTTPVMPPSSSNVVMAQLLSVILLVIAWVV